MQSGEFKHAYIHIYAEGACLDLLSYLFSQHFCLLACVCFLVSPSPDPTVWYSTANYVSGGS